MASLTELLDCLDPTDSLRRGKQFEHISHWFLTHDPTYAHEIRQVWLWDDWPRRWGADAGIDLVAVDRHGRLWAIQAKAYAETTSITKRDVDTFISESARSIFSFRLLIATTNLIGTTASRTLENQDKQSAVRHCCGCRVIPSAARKMGGDATVFGIIVVAIVPKGPRWRVEVGVESPLAPITFTPWVSSRQLCRGAAAAGHRFDSGGGRSTEQPTRRMMQKSIVVDVDILEVGV
ncbi:restriction endonuclease [Nocardia fluminea]|uniref:restriction endonuclease n=1 Tax=Nocardia fluminea TaxID=134984 RepID=UPI00343603B9